MRYLECLRNHIGPSRRRILQLLQRANRFNKIQAVALIMLAAMHGTLIMFCLPMGMLPQWGVVYSIGSWAWLSCFMLFVAYRRLQVSGGLGILPTRWIVRVITAAKLAEFCLYAMTPLFAAIMLGIADALVWKLCFVIQGLCGIIAHIFRSESLGLTSEAFKLAEQDEAQAPWN